MKTIRILLGCCALLAPIDAFVATSSRPLSSVRQQPIAAHVPSLASSTRTPASAIMQQPPEPAKGNGLPFFLDWGTKGGIVFYTFVLCALPFFAYNFMLDTLGYDVVLAGNVILVGYVGLGTVLWTSSYVFRVANKDMTYAQQVSRVNKARIRYCLRTSSPLIDEQPATDLFSFFFSLTQLRDYENAVIQKRFEELSEEEVDALMGEICARSFVAHPPHTRPIASPFLPSASFSLTHSAGSLVHCVQTRRRPVARRRSSSCTVLCTFNCAECTLLCTPGSRRRATRKQAPVW